MTQGVRKGSAMQELDLSDLKCPLPVLHTQKALASMAEGSQLHVLATDPMAAIDIPHFCTQKGHRLIKASQRGDRLAFIIEKGSERE